MGDGSSLLKCAFSAGNAFKHSDPRLLIVIALYINKIRCRSAVFRNQQRIPIFLDLGD